VELSEREDAALRDERVPVPRVLHLLTRDGWGGTEVQVMNLVQRTHPDRCEQTVAVIAPMVPGVGERLARNGVPVRSLAGGFGIVGKAARLAGILRERTYDVVEAYGFKAGLIARVGALLGGRPAVVIGVRGIHFTEGETHDTKARLAQLVERSLAWSVRAYAANSEGARRFLVRRGFPNDKFIVVLNGVETDVPLAGPDRAGPVRIICVARLVPRKRHDVLLEALARLRAGGRDVTCELVGAGTAGDDLRALTRRLGLESVVAFSGRLEPEETKQRLADADVFVLSSAWEGMPGSVMEAMAARLPVVATDVNGTNEIVIDDETGLLVPVDDVEALAAALERLSRDPSLRRRMGTAGRKRILDYSFDSFAERKTAFYRELAAEQDCA
jgi:glycosyltransferase involved in cell wall biosynthesis